MYVAVYVSGVSLGVWMMRTMGATAEGRAAMGHVIEAAKTGRASCRTCKKPILKGELRLGEEVANAFAAGETTYQWHHLPCAAKKKPTVLAEALQATELPIPDRDKLDAEIQQSSKKVKPTTFPYAEHAPSSRSSCIQCNEPIEKGTLRVAVERDVDTGSFVTTGAGYLHPGCAVTHTGESADALLAKLQEHSPALEGGDLAMLKAELG